MKFLNKKLYLPFILILLCGCGKINSTDQNNTAHINSNSQIVSTSTLAHESGYTVATKYNQITDNESLIQGQYAESLNSDTLNSMNPGVVYYINESLTPAFPNPQWKELNSYYGIDIDLIIAMEEIQDQAAEVLAYAELQTTLQELRRLTPITATTLIPLDTNQPRPTINDNVLIDMMRINNHPFQALWFNAIYIYRQPIHGETNIIRFVVANLDHNNQHTLNPITFTVDLTNYGTFIPTIGAVTILTPTPNLYEINLNAVMGDQLLTIAITFNRYSVTSSRIMRLNPPTYSINPASTITNIYYDSSETVFSDKSPPVDTYVMTKDCEDTGSCIYKMGSGVIESQPKYTKYDFLPPKKSLDRKFTAYAGFNQVLFIGSNLGEIFTLTKGNAPQPFANHFDGKIKFMGQATDYISPQMKEKSLRDEVPDPTELYVFTDKSLYTCDVFNTKPNCKLLNQDSIITNLKKVSSFIESGNGYLAAFDGSAIFKLGLNTSGVLEWTPAKIYNQVVPSSESITYILEDPAHSGLKYIFTSKNHILEKNEVANFFEPLNLPFTESTIAITARAIGKDGSLYIGTNRGALYKHSFITKSWTTLGQANVVINALADGVDDKLYFGAEYGNQYDSVWNEFSDKFNLLMDLEPTSIPINSIDVDNQNNVYITVGKQLRRMDAKNPGSWQVVLDVTNNLIYGMLTKILVNHYDNSIYVSTAGNGYVFHSLDGLIWNNPINTIPFDDSPITTLTINKDQLLIVTQNGNTFIYNPSRPESSMYDPVYLGGGTPITAAAANIQLK